MAFTLRITLVLVSILTFIFIIRRIRFSKIRVEDALFWIIFAVLVLFVSVFPQVFVAGSELLGIESPANLVFLFFIFMLLIKCFSISVSLSQTNEKVKELSQQLAIEKFERHIDARRTIDEKHSKDDLKVNA